MWLSGTMLPFSKVLQAVFWALSWAEGPGQPGAWPPSCTGVPPWPFSRLLWRPLHPLWGQFCPWRGFSAFCGLCKVLLPLADWGLEGPVWRIGGAGQASTKGPGTPGITCGPRTLRFSLLFTGPMKGPSFSAFAGFLHQPSSAGACSGSVSFSKKT